MAPIAKGKASGQGARSRNTTPLSATSTEPGSAVPNTTPSNMSYAEISELCRSSSTPSSTILKRLADGLRQRSEIAKTKSSQHDVSFREYEKRKEKEVERHHEQEAAREREEEALRAEEKRVSPKKEVEDEEEDDEDERPLAVGARGLARQDGAPSEAISSVPDSAASENHEPEADLKRKRSRDEGSETAEDSVQESRQPRPAPAKPQYQTFGPDPSTFDDPTIYHIRDAEAATSEEEKREILGVAEYPQSDLSELTCGPAPDRNLEAAKPPQQTSAHVFAQYLEPYFKKFTEEDVQWLKERSDRVTPMVMPPRGARHYKDVWADDEHDLMYGERGPNTTSQGSTNQAHGSIEQMSEDVTETSDVSIGPMLARLLQCMRPERRTEPQANNNAPVTTNGDTSMTNGIDGDVSMTDGQQPAQDVPAPQPTFPSRNNRPPATALPESANSGPKAPAPKPSWAEMDDRVKQELRYIGFLSEDAEPDYDGHYDDDIAARLRYLQEELEKVSVMNGARKSRVLELVNDAQSTEEYVGVLDHLESDLNQAYLKRHRNTAKGKGKLKRAGAAAGYSGPVPGAPGAPAQAIPTGAGISRPGLGENIKSILDRRNHWQGIVGPPINWGKMEVPKESVFGEEALREHMIREKDSWNESQET